MHWTVDGQSKGVTEQRLTLKRCVGRNVHPASLRGQGMPLAVHDGGWAGVLTGNGWLREALEQRSAPVEGRKALLPLSSSRCRGIGTPPASGAGSCRFDSLPARLAR